MPFARWIALRQARAALAAGRLDSARRLLGPDRGGRLAARLAAAYRARAERALRDEHPESAWKDLLAAEDLVPLDPAAAALRATLTRLGLAECRAALAAGRASFAADRLAALRRRRAAHPEFGPLELAAAAAVRAREQADRGDFEAALAAAGGDRPKAEFARRAEVVREAVPKLAECVAARRWPEALRHAEAILGAAPRHREARAGKAAAWAALQPSGDRPTQPGRPAVPEAEPQIPLATLVEAPAIPRRFLLWIDGVGGYLVCTAARVAFGQAGVRGPVDVPLFADVSRLHAEVRRDGEGYVLESGQDVAVNGTATRRAVLTPGDRVTLGTTCQLLFDLPVPVSPTAKLELASGHRLPVAVDAVWLMADNLVFGAAPPAHVVVPDLGGPAVLFRSKAGLGFRCPGRFRVDGEPHEGKATLRVPCHVTTEQMSFALEDVPGR